MKTVRYPLISSLVSNRPSLATAKGLISALRVGALLAMFGVMITGIYFASSASATNNAKDRESSSSLMKDQTLQSFAEKLPTSAGPSTFDYLSFLAVPPASPEMIATYASDCTTPKSLFHIGDDVCAKATDVPVSSRSRSLSWATPDGTLFQSTAFTGSSFQQTIHIDATTVINGRTIDNRGAWQIFILNPFFRFREASVIFTVADPANPSADLQIDTVQTPNGVAAGSQAVFKLQIVNNGPDNSENVKLTDAIPTGTSFVSFQQLSGPVFTCVNPAATDTSGTTTCSIGILIPNNPAVFVATYQVDNGATAGTQITNTAQIKGLDAIDNPNGTSDPYSLNNSTTASTVVARTPCVITCPSNITQPADSGQAGAVVTYATPSSVGDCGQPTTGEGGEVIPAISCSPVSGSFFGAGTTIVICTAQTGDTCTFQVTVENPGALSITLNGANPLAVECGSDFNDPGASAVNGSGQSVPVTVALPQGFNPDSPAVGSYTITYTATEGANSVSTTRTVNVADTQPPTITIAGANPYKIQQGSCSPFVDPGVSANDGCAGPKPVTTSIAGPNGQTSVNPSVAGTYTVTYTATDGTHQATATRTVLVGNFPQDEVDQPASTIPPPTITLVGDDQMSIECGTPFTDPGATATQCGNSVAVTTSGTVDIHTPGTYNITYTATGNSQTTTATRSVTVTPDNTAPTITVTGANPMTVECHGTFSDPGAVAHDACAGDFAATPSGTVDPNTVGQYTITYNATDPSGHAATPVTRTVIVRDTTAPVVTAPANVTVYTGSGATACSATVSDATLGTASANDACQGSLSTTRSGVPSGNVFPVGVTTITYSATDAGNNTGTKTQTVTVVDNTPPTITLSGANPIVVECHTSFADPGAIAHDNCGDFAATASGAVNANTVGTYTVNYNATDTAGNAAAQVSRTVIVRDTIAPTITLNGASPMTVECHTTFTDPGATANDTCNGSVAVTASNNVNPNVPGSYTVIYTAHDASNNTTTVTRTVNVVDTTGPTITIDTSQHMVWWPPNHQYESITVNDFVLSASDSCDSTVNRSKVRIWKITSDEAENGPGSGNTLNDIVIASDCKSAQMRAEREGSGDGRVYTIYFKVTDAAGNTATATAKTYVPKSGNGNSAVDSGPHYTVTSGCP